MKKYEQMCLILAYVLRSFSADGQPTRALADFAATHAWDFLIRCGDDQTAAFLLIEKHPMAPSSEPITGLISSLTSHDPSNGALISLTVETEDDLGNFFDVAMTSIAQPYLISRYVAFCRFVTSVLVILVRERRSAFQC